MNQNIQEGLFQRFQSGDEEAFKVIFNQYVGLIQFVAGKFSLSETEKDEVVQETFLRLYKNIKKIETFEKIKPWLCITARNYSIDLKRDQKKQKEFTRDLSTLKDSELTEGSQSADRVELALMKEMQASVIPDLINELGSASERLTFTRFYIDNLTVKEIAEQNHEAVGTVTSRLSRVRKKLKESIQQRIQKLQKESGRHGE